jgi:hypothetical protein
MKLADLTMHSSVFSRPICLACTWLTAVFITLGCGGSHHLETAPVTGVVTIDGKPLGQGVVTFTPVPPPNLLPAKAKTARRSRRAIAT